MIASLSFPLWKGDAALQARWHEKAFDIRGDRHLAVQSPIFSTVSDVTGPEQASKAGMGHDVQVRVFDTLEDLQSLIPAWEDLLEAVPTATIFSTWEWLAPWWRAFGKQEQLWVLAFFASCQKLVGLAPFALGDFSISLGIRLRRLKLMGDGSRDSDNLDLLVRPGCEFEVTRTLVDYLEHHASLWDICQFNTTPSHSAGCQELLSHLRQRGWIHFLYPRPCSAVVLPESWEAYITQLSTEEQTNVKRYSRRLSRRYGVSFRQCAKTAELSTDLDTLFRLHQKRWQTRGEPGTFAVPARRRFYDDMARLFLARGWLQFWFLDLNGEAAASQFAFRYRDTVFQLQEGFDPAHASDRVGYVLRAHVLKQLIAEGVRRYDFLGGRDPSKTRWGAQAGTYMDLHFARPLSRGAIYLRLVDDAAHSKEWVRRHASSQTWALLHWLKGRLRGSPE